MLAAFSLVVLCACGGSTTNPTSEAAPEDGAATGAESSGGTGSGGGPADAETAGAGASGGMGSSGGPNDAGVEPDAASDASTEPDAASDATVTDASDSGDSAVPTEGPVYYACHGTGGSIQVVLSKLDESTGTCVKVLFLGNPISTPFAVSIQTTAQIAVGWACRTTDLSACDPANDDWTVGPVATAVTGSIAYSDDAYNGQPAPFWPQSGMDIHLVLDFETDAGMVTESIDVDGCSATYCVDGLDCRIQP
jgi:hypothetical protein